MWATASRKKDYCWCDYQLMAVNLDIIWEGSQLSSGRAQRAQKYPATAVSDQIFLLQEKKKKSGLHYSAWNPRLNSCQPILQHKMPIQRTPPSSLKTCLFPDKWCQDIQQLYHRSIKSWRSTSVIQRYTENRARETTQALGMWQECTLVLKASMDPYLLIE